MKTDELYVTEVLHVTELFYSLQGEGRYAGTPSVFLRTWGCPFTCQGFGQDRDKSKWQKESQMPHKDVNLISTVSDITDLPVPVVGCDSSYSWAKETKHLAKKMTGLQASIAVGQLMVKSCASPDGVHLVITGGEPLITKSQKALITMLRHLFREHSQTRVTFETNGYYNLTDAFVAFFNTEFPSHEVTFSISPKLALSGEDRDRALQPGSVSTYSLIKNSFIYLKYVVRDEVDIPDADFFTQQYRAKGIPIQEVYLMPEGALNLSTCKKVAELCLKYGYKYSPRLHLDLFGNAWGT